jgi:hypothetical protein
MTLKLAAADAEDLEILSARLQDAAAKLKDLVWLPKQRRFAGLFNRYRWEEKKPRGDGSRVRAGLYFDGVSAVQSQNIKLGAPDAVVSLLAIRFTPEGADDTAGVVELIFAGGGALRLQVEALDAVLTDLTGPWDASARPAHEETR